jgi:cell division transport system permease protein
MRYKIDSVTEKLKLISGIDYIRNNREILDRLSGIVELLRVLGFLVVAAAGITTIVIISHIIRLGIQSNSDQINTLGLLGAPRFFIALPFVMEGLLLALIGGIFAAMLSACALKYVYMQTAGLIPFIPLPPGETLIPGIMTLIIFLSALLGIMGSILGLSFSNKS